MKLKLEQLDLDFAFSCEEQLDIALFYTVKQKPIDYLPFTFLFM